MWRWEAVILERYFNVCVPQCGRSGSVKTWARTDGVSERRGAPGPAAPPRLGQQGALRRRRLRERLLPAGRGAGRGAGRAGTGCDPRLSAQNQHGDRICFQGCNDQPWLVSYWNNSPVVDDSLTDLKRRNWKKNTEQKKCPKIWSVSKQRQKCKRWRETRILEKQKLFWVSVAKSVYYKQLFYFLSRLQI